MAVDTTIVQAPAAGAWRGVSPSSAVTPPAAPPAAGADPNEAARAKERISAHATLMVTMVLVVAFLGMHSGELAAAVISGDKDVLLRAFDHLSAARASVLAVLAALFAPSPLQR
jgi:hypothetical protein